MLINRNIHLKDRTILNLLVEEKAETIIINLNLLKLNHNKNISVMVNDVNYRMPAYFRSRKDKNE